MDSRNSQRRSEPTGEARRWGIASIILGVPVGALALYLGFCMALWASGLGDVHLTPKEAYWTGLSIIDLLIASLVALGFVIGGTVAAMSRRSGRVLLLSVATVGILVAAFQFWVSLNDMHYSTTYNESWPGIVLSLLEVVYCMALIRALKKRSG